MEKIQKQSRYEIRFMTEKGNVIVGRYFDSRDGIKKDLDEVNHIDGDKTNNCEFNLEWCNQSENMQHAFKLGLNVNPYGEKHNRAILTEEIYLKCVELREQGLTYTKIAEHVSNEYNIKIGRTSINAALIGQTWSHIKTKNLRSYGNRKPKAGY